MIALLLGLLILVGSSAVLVPLLDEPTEPALDRAASGALIVVCLGIVYLVAYRAGQAVLG